MSLLRSSLSSFSSLSRLTPSLLPRSSCSSLSSLSSIAFIPRRGFAVHHIHTEEDLQTTVKDHKDKLIVIDWFATWCGPCRAIAPLMDKLSEEHSDAHFIKVDVDELPDAAQEAGVEAMPTFHFIKGEKLVASLTGADPNKLKEIVKKFK